MVDDAGLLLEKYGKEVKAAIVGGIETGVAASNRFFTRLCVATIFGSMLGAAGMAYLVSPPPPRPAAEWLIHHADGLVEVCALPTEATDERPVFVCHLVPSGELPK